MTPDGISTEDWDRVHELALDVVNTSAEGDEKASARASDRLRGVLDELQEKYGPLPSLLATRADYVDRGEDREYWLLAAYDQAQQRQDAKNLVWIAESLASLYLEERSDREKGTEWLTALERHLQTFHDAYEAKQASRLREILERRQPSGPQNNEMQLTRSAPARNRGPRS
jgi:hypothetical protein